METIPDIDTTIQPLGPATIPSRILFRKYVEDSERILYDQSVSKIQEIQSQGRVPASFELAGPRRRARG